MSLKTAADLIAAAQKEISCLDPAAAKQLYDHSENAVVIDVREADASQASKLDDSVNISRGLVEMKVPKICPDPDTVIFTHCAGGGRASLAAYTLKQMGYRNVHAITAPFENIKEVFD